MFPSPRRVSEPRTAQREQANRRRQAVARHLALRGRQESHHLELHLGWAHARGAHPLDEALPLNPSLGTAAENSARGEMRDTDMPSPRTRLGVRAASLTPSRNRGRYRSETKHTASVGPLNGNDLPRSSKRSHGLIPALPQGIKPWTTVIP